LLALVAVALLVPGAVEGKKRKKNKQRSPTELLNLFVGPSYSQWLRGAISYIATDEEIEAYLQITEDGAAEAFIEEFWRRRDPRPETAANPVRELFDERSAEADKLYSEAAIPGRSTDRGAVFIVYGEPSQTHYDIASSTREPIPGRNTDISVETWTYDKDVEEGLDGRRPEKIYRFARDGEVTKFYVGKPGTRIQRPTRLPNER
jgi:GWxTD domain-containing protein